MPKLNKLSAALFACAALTLVNAQTLPRIDREADARPRELISEGLGVGRVYVGRSTADDVASVYGKTFETVEHGAQGTEMRFTPLGLSFYYCRADERKVINRIEARAPFDAFTARGIVLGKSSARDVLAAYGASEPTNGGEGGGLVLRYFGVEFTVANKESGKSASVSPGAKITAIHIVTSRAGSDCGTPNPK
jgi:hypothetical protein